MDAAGVKQAVGLFLRQLPDEITLEDHETVDDALVRLRTALQHMSSTNPAFWKLALVSRMKALVRDNMSSIIEDTVDRAMQDDPSWMVLPANQGDHSALDTAVDEMLAKHPVVFVKLQRQLSDKVSAEVRSVMEYLQKHVKSGTDLQQLFKDSANDVVKLDAEAQKSVAQPPNSSRDTQVFSLDNLGDDEWGEAIAPGDEGAAPFSLSAVIDRMKHCVTAASRADVLHQVEHTPTDCIVQAESFAAFCIALVPLFFHADSCDRALTYFWKIVHAADDIAIQCALFVDLIAALLALPPSHLCLRKSSFEPAAPPAPQHQHHHHHADHPPHQPRPLLNVSRVVLAFMQLLPSAWIYAPSELRANVMLSACHLIVFSIETIETTATNSSAGHGAAVAAALDDVSKPLPPSSLLAYLDPSSQWFTHWHLRSPLQEQWLRVVVQSGLVAHLVGHLVFAHERMDLWRKVEPPRSAHHLTRRRSARSVVQGSPKTPPHTSSHAYGELHRRMLLQTIHMLLTVLPHSTIQAAFPVLARNPFKDVPAKSPMRQSVSAASPSFQPRQAKKSRPEPDDATNNLLYHVTAPPSTHPHVCHPDTVSVSHDVVCLHLALVGMAQAWTPDLWVDQPDDKIACGPLTASLVESAQNHDFYLVLFDVLSAVLSLSGESTPQPRDVGAFRFPYEAGTHVSSFLDGTAKALLLQFLVHLIPQALPKDNAAPVVAKHPQVMTSIKDVMLPMLIAAAMALPPTPTTGERIAALVCAPWCSVEMIAAVARCSALSPWWIVHFHRTASFEPALRSQIEQMNCVATRSTVVSDMCATAVGLLHYHDLLLPLLPLECLWEPPPSHRSMHRICQLANIPAVSAAWLGSPRRQNAWRNAIRAMREDVQGIEAVYGSLSECPYSLRVPVHEWWQFRTLCATPYTADASFSIGDLTHPKEEQDVDAIGSFVPHDDIQEFVACAFCYDVSATSFQGCQLVSDKYLDGFPKCTCAGGPDELADDDVGCFLDPPSWMRHSVRQFLASVGGADESKRTTAMVELPPRRALPLSPPAAPIPAAVTCLHQCVQQVLGAIDSAASYLDFFDPVVDAFWRTLACFESECASTATPEITMWFGDMLWAVVCSGKSRWTKDSTPRRPLKPWPGQGNDTERSLHWANTWTKAYGQTSGSVHDPVGCSTLLRKVFHSFGHDAADPFVWTCLMMLADRKLNAEVVGFFTALHTNAGSMYVWPEQRRRATTTAINTPLVRIAAAVEIILHVEFPRIALALRRLDCPVLSLVLRWQRACFWNVLNWGEIMGFVTLACLHGVDAVVYLHVIVLHHIGTHQLDAIATGDQLLRLQIEPRLHWSAYQGLFNRLRKAHYELVIDVLDEHGP